MRIKTKINQYRRDFIADYECEFCGHVYRGSGYDDSHFHREVIPSMRCSECGKSSGQVSSSPSIPDGVVM